MSQSDTKKRLIDSAIKLFSEKGYFSTKVSDIVKDAGVAQGTFYLYFKSKEDIFLFIVEEIVLKINSLINEFYKLNLNPQEKIKGFGKEAFRLLFEYKDVAEIYFFHLLCTDDKFKEIHFQTESSIRTFYLDTLRDYKDKELLTDIILGFAKRLFEIKLLKEKASLDKVLEEFEEGVNLVFRGLK